MMLFMWREAWRGALAGFLLGGVAALGFGLLGFFGNWLFPGDTAVFGALAGGVIGFLFGDGFVEWLKSWWYWLI